MNQLHLRYWVLGVVVVLTAPVVAYRLGRDHDSGPARLHTFTGVLTGATYHGEPSCVRADPGQGLDTRPDVNCGTFWRTEQMGALTSGEHVQATYVDAVLPDGEAFQGFVIAPVGAPSN